MTPPAMDSVNARPRPKMPPFHGKIVLKRTGKKTMRFAGDLLTDHTGYNRASAYWYEICVFSRVVGGFAAAVRHFTKAESERDRFTAERFDTLEEVMTFLERYDPQNDITIGFDPAAPALSAAEVTVLAAGLRARKADHAHAYESVVSDALQKIEALAQSAAHSSRAA